MDTPVVTTAGICAGVGMLDLGVSIGLEYLGVRAKPAFVAEWDSYSAAVLKSRMEESSLEPCPIWCGDMADFDSKPWAGAVDMFVAGIPCQPFSVAGKQEGTGDERWLWPELFRLIRECGPSLVFIENVPGFVQGGLGPVLSDLASIGFDAEWLSLTAESVGASHRRERVFVLAYMADNPITRSRRVPESGDGPAAADVDGECAELGNATGINGGQRQRQRFGAKADAGGEHGSEGSGSVVGDSTVIGEREPDDETGAEPQRSGPRRGTGGTGGDVANTNSKRRQQNTGSSPGNETTDGGTRRNWLQQNCDNQPTGTCSSVADAYGLPLFAPGPSDPRWPGILAQWPWLAPAVESGVRMSASGMAVVVDQSRADQLRCAGNGVVVVQSAAAFIELVRRAMK